MKSAKKLVTFVLPDSAISEAKKIRRKYGFRTLSALLRAVVDEVDEKLVKPAKRDKTQISLRVAPESFAKIAALAKRNKKSVSEILRLHFANISKIPSKRLTTISQELAERRRNKKHSFAKTGKSPAKLTTKRATNARHQPKSRRNNLPATKRNPRKKAQPKPTRPAKTRATK
ncbi:MAG: hypothetical protein LUD39_06620 [Opitutae bacterium]|nr:hypothetical protein [Opitutae bacterium]MCD8299403.1 hypothetical protein [Opitutae bacterium]